MVFSATRFYDPEINRAYGVMAAHYSVGILPARPYKPRDNTKVFIPVRISMGMSSMSMTMPSTAINKVSTHLNC